MMKDNTIPSSENSSPDFDSFIHSIRVIFPPGRLPFTSQFQVLNKTIQAYKEGSDALIESPTGTGKTLSLLTGALAYQKAVSNFNNGITRDDEKEAIPFSSFEYQRGSFIRRRHFSLSSSRKEAATKPSLLSSSSSQIEFPKGRVRIIYCSRTHSQLDQIAQELSKCPSYYLNDLIVTPIGSKKYLCSNRELRELIEKKKYRKSLSSFDHGMEDNEKLKILVNRLKNRNEYENENIGDRIDNRKKKSKNEEFQYDSIILNDHTRKRNGKNKGLVQEIDVEMDDERELSIEEACSQALNCRTCPYYSQEKSDYLKQQEAIKDRLLSLEFIENYRNKKKNSDSFSEIVTDLSEIPFNSKFTNNLKSNHYSPYQYKSLSFVKKMNPFLNGDNKNNKERLKKVEKRIKDVDDLLDLSQLTKACSYYTLRDTISISDVILAPYNYIVDPIIRKRLKINLNGGQLTQEMMKKRKKKDLSEDIKGETTNEEIVGNDANSDFINDILIFDEGHHLEDRAREVATIKISLLDLHQLIYELSLCATPFEDEDKKNPLIQPTIIKNIVDILLDIINFIFEMNFSNSNTNINNNWNNKCIWNGDDFLQNLENFTNKRFGGLNQLSTILDVLKELLKENDNGEVSDQDEFEESIILKKKIPVTLASLYFLEKIINVFNFLYDEVKAKRNTFNVYIEDKINNNNFDSNSNNNNFSFYTFGLFNPKNMIKKFNLFKQFFNVNINLKSSSYYNNYYSHTFNSHNENEIDLETYTDFFELNKINYDILTALSVKKNNSLNDLKFLSLNIICLEASVVMLPLSLSVRSLVLASGTLSPIDALAQECGFGKEYVLRYPENTDLLTNMYSKCKEETKNDEIKEKVSSFSKNFYKLEATHNLIDIKNQIFVRQGGTVYMKNINEVKSISSSIKNLSHELLKNCPKFYLNHSNDFINNSKVVNEEINKKLPLNSSFNCTYKSQQEEDFFINLTLVFLNFFINSPGGFLLFLPSYNLLFKLSEYWEKSFIFVDNKFKLIHSNSTFDQANQNENNSTPSRLKKISLLKYIEFISDGKIFFEPKDNSNNKFKVLLEDFILTIDPNSKSTSLKSIGKKKNLKKNFFRGAFIGVYRGKLSEGSDFSDKLTRTILLVGIPYSNPNDLFIQLKKKYQDNLYTNYKKNKDLGGRNLLPLSGEEWYKQCAYRALNQAIGRGVRHSKDYAAIILFDSRHSVDNGFNTNSNNFVSPYLSKWLQPFIKNNESFLTKDLDQFKIFFNFLENSSLYNESLNVEVEIKNNEFEIEGLVSDQNLLVEKNNKKLGNNAKKESKLNLTSYFQRVNVKSKKFRLDSSNDNIQSESILEDKESIELLLENSSANLTKDNELLKHNIISDRSINEEIINEKKKIDENYFEDIFEIKIQYEVGIIDTKLQPSFLTDDFSNEILSVHTNATQDISDTDLLNINIDLNDKSELCDNELLDFMDEFEQKFKQ